MERWFAEITNKRIRPGIFRSVRELETAIRAYIDVHNEDPQPLRLDPNGGRDSGKRRTLCQTDADN